MVLSDRSIKQSIVKGEIGIEPWREENLQPASVDLTLHREVLVFEQEQHSLIDTRESRDGLTKPRMIPEDRPFILHPGQFILASTNESVTLADDKVARIEGKSSLGRLGLVIHSTAGFVDPGWTGQITLELSNNAGLPITLYRDMKICQVSFMQLTTPADRPYGTPGLGSRYMHQSGPTASRASG